MLYVKSILVGILVGTVSLFVSAVLAILIVVSQVRQRTPGTEVGVNIRSLMWVPVFWIVALVDLEGGVGHWFSHG